MPSGIHNGDPTPATSSRQGGCTNLIQCTDDKKSLEDAAQSVVDYAQSLEFIQRAELPAGFFTILKSMVQEELKEGRGMMPFARCDVAFLCSDPIVEVD